ncbi:MAG: hypothetical protein P8Y70_20245, partial [Candidatus Lokiarchaeota archaeon]
MLQNIVFYPIIESSCFDYIGSYFGEFEVVLYEEPPDVIFDDNTIYVSIPNSVNNDMEDYYLYIEVWGNVRNEYLCNITYMENGSLLDNFNVWTNSSEYSTSSIFNTSLTLDIYNINNSYSLVFS